MLFIVKRQKDGYIQDQERSREAVASDRIFQKKEKIMCKERKSTGFFDKTGQEIFVGDKVRFKYMGRLYTEVVEEMGNYYYPFNPNISVEAGFYVEPSKCRVVK